MYAGLGNLRGRPSSVLGAEGTSKCIPCCEDKCFQGEGDKSFSNSRWQPESCLFYSLH